MNESVKSIDVDLEKAVEIVAAYVSQNSLRQSDLPGLIVAVHSSIRQLGRGLAPAPVEVPAAAPAVPIKKSVTHEHIVCLEDGRKFKSLRRHLLASHNLTPDQYRVKWGLPSDHPMVAPAYSVQRSQLARDLGLGCKPTVTGEKQGAADPAAEATEKPRRGRSRKSALG